MKGYLKVIIFLFIFLIFGNQELLSQLPENKITKEEYINLYKDIALEEMKQEATRLGANAVVAVDLDYETIGSGGGNMLMVSASGTAVAYEET